MRVSTPNVSRRGTREALEHALAAANIPVLLMVLVHLSDDERWIRDPYRMTRAKGMSDNDTGGLDEEVQAEIRSAALDLVLRWEEGEVELPKDITEGRLTTMMGACVCDDVDREFVPLVLEEMALKVRGLPVSERRSPSAARDDVLVIGAGMSGICAGIKLGEAGIPYSIVEKDTELGGTWFENDYPGAGVDTPSHLYSFSFAQDPGWNRYYAKQPEIQAYLRSCAVKYGVTDNIRFDTTVESCSFDRERSRWDVQLRYRDGSVESRQYRFVISAVGQLNIPKIPELPGLEEFEGDVFHSARWRHDVDLTGRRVAMVGTGASGMQIAPRIASQVGELLIFQGSPQWAAPNENYFREVSDETQYLMATVPFYAGWYRFRLFWSFNDRVHRSLQIDPDWPDQTLSINATNEAHRQHFTRYIESELGPRTDLLPRVVPDYPPFGKRMLIDNGWFRLLREPNVELVDSRVCRLTATGVVDEAGAHHEVDVVVLSTGFESLHLLDSVRVQGSNGQTLRDTWGVDDAQAYLGITVPGFPNFFCLYGPNTNLGHGGSIIFHTECQVRYIVDLIAQMADGSLVSADCRREVHEEYSARVDEAHSRMIWTHPKVHSWYTNRDGRVVTNSPWRLVDYWRMTERADLSDYICVREERVSTVVKATGRN